MLNLIVSEMPISGQLLFGSRQCIDVFQACHASVLDVINPAGVLLAAFSYLMSQTAIVFVGLHELLYPQNHYSHACT